MPSMSPLRAIGALVFGLLPATAQDGRPEFVDTRYSDASVHFDGDERWLCCRIVDGITGAPIQSAEVLLIAESDAPVGGELWHSMRAEADDDGFVTLRIDPKAQGYRKWHWLCARAEGYCQRMEMGAFDDAIVRLCPAVAVPVQIRDWRDRPVPGATVGFCSGCGHTPDLVHGTTGANGVVTLPGVDLHAGIADFYVVHPELELGYTSPNWHPGRWPMAIRLAPGVAHRGVVVDAAGAPVAGAAVGMPGVHRGPWTETRADGTFELSGLDGVTDLFVRAGGQKYLFEERGAEGLRLALPAPSGEDTQLVELTEAERARDAERHLRRVDLERARERAWPRVIVRTVGLPEDGGVVLRAGRRTWELDDAVAQGRPVPLPDSEFVFELHAEHAVRIVPGDRERAVRDGVVRLRWFAPTRVEGRVVTEEGEALAADVALAEAWELDGEADDWVEVRGGLSLATTSDELRFLHVLSRYSSARRVLPVVLPPRGDDAFVDVGTIVVEDAASPRFERADGAPLVGGSVTVLRAGWRDLADGWEFHADDDGAVWPVDLLPGDALLVSCPTPPPGDLGDSKLVDLPSRFVVGPGGPRRFRMHGGELLLRVDADGQPPVAIVGDHALPLDGPTLLRGLEPGRHRVFVGAPGRRSAVVEVEVPAAHAGRARVMVALPAR